MRWTYRLLWRVRSTGAGEYHLPHHKDAYHIRDHLHVASIMNKPLSAHPPQRSAALVHKMASAETFNLGQIRVRL